MSVARKRVYMVKTTQIERCFYDPDEIAREFGWPMAGLPDETFEDFVIRIFERFNGSIYHDEFFPGDASPDFWTELEERWDDE